MKEALELKSKSGVHRLISALEERGFIRRLPNRARALEILRMPDAQAGARRRGQGAGVAPPAAANDVIDLPLHGRIAAGMPIEALEGQTTLPVPAALLGPGEHYALEVAGDSMVDEGILDGDYALIRKTDTARDGEIVVALIDDNEATLKTYRKEGQMVRLDPGQPPLRPAALPARAGPDPGPAGGAAAALLRACASPSFPAKAGNPRLRLEPAPAFAPSGSQPSPGATVAERSDRDGAFQLCRASGRRHRRRQGLLRSRRSAGA